MKTLLLILCLMPVMALAQSKEDYKRVMAKFVAYYNNNQDDSICTLFSKGSAPNQECFWTWAASQRELPHATMKEYGKIRSFKYLGKTTEDPEKVTVFKVLFQKKSVKAMSFNLGKDHKFGTFRFDTSSEEIEKMIKDSE